MPPTYQPRFLKALSRKVSPVAVAMTVIPLLVSLTACTSNVDLSKKENSLSSRDTTVDKDEVLFPDAIPSVADGKAIYAQAQCASCHGDDGKGVSGQCDVDLSNVEWMRQRKPVDQYRLITFGQAEEHKQVVTSGLAAAELSGETEKPGRMMKHEPFRDKLNKRQRWNLVFYTRSLAVPLLSNDELLATKAVFGANCAVCHGSRGAGDGQLNKGLVLQPAPANFTQYDRFYDRTDEQIWDHIANGIKWEGMPNFLGKEDRGNKVKFDADYIWHLVQYVRNFHEDPNPTLEGKQTARIIPGSDKALSNRIESSQANAKTLAKEPNGSDSVQ